ncbi:hypothetical protein ACHAQH_009144 [Verticillium albo-atrum]
MPLDVDGQTRSKLQEIGFVAVTETVIKLPINPWGSQESEKELGKWFNAALSQAAHSMSIAPLTRSERWSKDDVLKLVDDTCMDGKEAGLKLRDRTRRMNSSGTDEELLHY